MVEGARLESVYTGQLVSGVRIPPLPPELNNDHKGRYLVLMNGIRAPDWQGSLTSNAPKAITVRIRC